MGQQRRARASARHRAVERTAPRRCRATRTGVLVLTSMSVVAGMLVVAGGSTSGASPVSATVSSAPAMVPDHDRSPSARRMSPPPPPVFTGPPPGPVDSGRPTFTGTALPGDVVGVFDDFAFPTCSTTADADGAWSCTADEALDDGPYTFTAVAIGPDGQGSADSAPLDLVIDTVAPDAPEITGPVNGTTIADSTPTITGTGEPGATATVTGTGGQVIGSALVGDDGTWALTAAKPVKNGQYTVTAEQTDPAGNRSGRSPPVSFVVDAPLPPAPVITGPADGSTTSDTTPAVSGTGQPGARVTVREGATMIGTAVVGSDVNWTFTPAVPLTDGPHAFVATQTDRAGNTSPASSPDTFIVDTTAPAAPVISGPADGITTRDNTLTVSGTGEPGATVTVVDGTTRLGTASVGPDGTWAFTPVRPLADGPHTVIATQTDRAGNTSPSSHPVTITVDTAAPAAPVITGPADGSTTGDNTPTVSGTGEPGAVVTVRDGDTVLGTTTVDPDGTWTFTPTATVLSDGTHTVVATQTDRAGNTSPASAPVTITVDTTAPRAPVITGPADGSTTGDDTPTVSGTGEPGAVVTVRDGDITLGTTTVGADGSWTFTPATPLADGSHTLIATQTDGVGNVSSASNPVTITVDTTAPAQPVITAPAADTVLSQDAPTPQVTGTGAPGDTITVLVDGEPGCVTTVGPDGTWTCTPSMRLTPGPHIASVTETDPAGNTSAPSTATVIKRPAVDLVVSSTVSDGQLTVGERSTITVTFVNLGPDSEPAATVTALIGGPVRYVSATAGVGAYDAGTGVWTLGAVGVGVQQTLTITVEGVQVGTADVRFTAAGTLAETQAANNISTVAIRVVAPATPSLGVSGSETSTSTPAPDPSSTDASSTDPSSTDPSSTDHSSTDPSSTDPSRTGPSSTGPSRTSPANGVLGSSTSGGRDATAYTGVDSRLGLLVGSLLVVLGAGLAALTRRRRPGSHH